MWRTKTSWNRLAGGHTAGNMSRSRAEHVRRTGVCVCVARYPGLLQVAVHGLGDIGSVDSVVVGILGVVVLLHHA